MNALKEKSGEEADILSLPLVLSILKRRWFFILLFSIMGAAVAFYVGAKQGYLFEKTARIILRDDKSKGNASDMVLSELGIKNNGENLANETYVLKSTHLMGQVVEGLKLNVTYWRMQDIRRIDVYQTSPINVDFVDVNENESVSFQIIPKNNEDFILTWENMNGEPQVAGGVFNQDLELPFATIKARPTSYLIEEAYDVPILVGRVSNRAATDALLSALNVLRPDSKEASIIELKIKTSNPKKSEDILNQLITVYNEASKDEKTIAAKKTEDFIKERINFIGGNLSDVDSQILTRKADSDILQDMSTTLGAGVSKIKELDDQIFSIETEIKQVVSLQEILKKQEQKRNILPVNLGVVDGSLANQIQQYNTAYLEYKKLEPSAGSKNPVIVSLQESMDAISRSIEQSIQNYLNGAEVKLNELAKSKKEVDATMIKTASSEKDLVPLQRQQKVMEELFLILLTKREENGLALAKAEESARVLEEAFGDNGPVAPKMRLMIVAGAGCGGVLCFLLFMGFAVMDTKVKTKYDLMDIVSVPVVGEIPSFTKVEKKNPDIIKLEKQSPFAESFYMLRSNVEALVPKSKDKKGKVILISSTRPAEGKTTITSNLAVAYEQGFKKVLVIDCDLRRGTLTKSFVGRRLEKGLSRLLLDEEQTIADNIITNEKYPGMDVMLSGPLPPNPAVLLSQSRFKEILEKAAEIYDKIIIDAPPYPQFADVKVLAKLSDVFLYLVRSQLIDKQYITQFLTELPAEQLNSMGFIINDVDFKKASHGYYGYRYSYDYKYGTKD